MKVKDEWFDVDHIKPDPDVVVFTLWEGTDAKTGKLVHYYNIVSSGYLRIDRRIGDGCLILQATPSRRDENEPNTHN